MKLGRKDAENLDLKKALNNAYEELAVLEKQAQPTFISLWVYTRL